MAYQIKGAITDLYNQLTEAEKAQIQAVGESAYTRYMGNWGANPNSQQLASGQQEAQEAAQRAAEALFNEKNRVIVQQQQEFPAKMDAFLAANQNTGGQEVNLSPELQGGVGGDLSRFVVVDGRLVSRGSVAQRIQEEADYAAGKTTKVQVGSGFAYIPKGSFAEANLPNIGTQNTANAANAGLPAQGQLPTGQTQTTTGTIKQGENLSTIVQSLGITPQEFLKLNPQFAAKGNKGDWQGLTGLIQSNQTYVIPGGTAGGTTGTQTGQTITQGQIDPNTGQPILYDPQTGRKLNPGETITLGGTGGIQQDGTQDGTSITSQKQNWINIMSQVPELKEIYDAHQLSLKQKTEAGERINPDLTISPTMAQRFLDEATSALDPYYQELIRQSKQDIDISVKQLQEDYDKTIQREEPAFQQRLEKQDIQEAEQGLAFSSGRNVRELGMIRGQQERLDDFTTGIQRSTEELGRFGERSIGSRVFSELGVPTIKSYTAQRGIPQPKGAITSTGSRQLFSPQGGVFGEIPGQRKEAIDTRQAQLEEEERKTRLLDYSSKFGLGSSYLG